VQREKAYEPWGVSRADIRSEGGAELRNRGLDLERKPRKRISLDINDIVAEALALARDDLEKNRISVEICLRPGLPKIAGDSDQLQQVVVKLVANAIDAMAASDET
jgi:two-component system, LuxR family, sensor kinase FixL